MCRSLAKKLILVNILCVLRYVLNAPKRFYDAKYNASWLFEGVTVNLSKGI
jgi:hypothetical protein